MVYIKMNVFDIKFFENADRILIKIVIKGGIM